MNFWIRKLLVFFGPPYHALTHILLVMASLGKSIIKNEIVLERQPLIDIIFQYFVPLVEASYLVLILGRKQISIIKTSNYKRRTPSEWLSTQQNKIILVKM